jgi:hypothetical protein
MAEEEKKEWSMSAEAQLEMANGCLHMTRDALAKYIPMESCPPMMYEEAVYNLAQFMFWLGSRKENPNDPKTQFEAFTAHRKKVLSNVPEGTKPTLADLAE